ncbi:MAG: type II toxin-antitoxin system RelE/ParE family toxin [Myxococcales bacterium]|nr:type II toxin-antitoxin system RelE/ParE family toxin [Myxococcales bacterium]
MLALEAFNKKTQKTPSSKITMANQRLRDWKSRATK